MRFAARENAVLGQPEVATRTAGPARRFAIVTTGNSLSLCHNMPSDAGPPARLGSLRGVLRDLGEIDMRHEVLRIGALQHHDPNVHSGLQRAEQGHQVAHQLRSDQVHRRRIDHDAQHTIPHVLWEDLLLADSPGRLAVPQFVMVASPKAAR
jgi:hypothetical protein